MSINGLIRYKQAWKRIVASLNNNAIYSYAITISTLHSTASINNLNGERVEFGEISVSVHQNSLKETIF